MPYGADVLPRGIRSRFVDNVNGLRVHILEAGFETSGRPAVLLLHGFPELAYSWRKVMVPIASAGFYVVAPDRRGYGRTSKGNVSYDDDLRPFGTLNQIVDALRLVSALGHPSVAAVIGHDQGSPLAGWCALARPDVFRSVVMMSAPFGGAPPLSMNSAIVPSAAGSAAPADVIYEDLAKLQPPRKHYQRYYQGREANQNLWHPPQGLHAFLRAYYHMKSADWTPNDPHPLAARTAAEWAKLPRYYIMDSSKGMAETVAAEMPSPAEIAACRWLPDSELRVYSEEYGRTGFQGGLNGYRTGLVNGDLQIFAGKRIDVPSAFMGGRKDWGVYQNPGALEQLEKVHTTTYEGTQFVDGAGHWVQQEQAEQVSQWLVEFLKRDGSRQRGLP
jgi:pimeloyl-ACP methyl ester carboxylesterase